MIQKSAEERFVHSPLEFWTVLSDGDTIGRKIDEGLALTKFSSQCAKQRSRQINKLISYGDSARKKLNRLWGLWVAQSTKHAT